MLMYADDFSGWGPTGIQNAMGRTYDRDPLSGYIVPETSLADAKICFCPSSKGDLLTNATYRAGRVTSTTIYSSYSLAFGSGNWSSTSRIYGWQKDAPSSTAAGAQRFQCPRVTMLGRNTQATSISGTVTVDFYLGSPESQAMVGDISSKLTNRVFLGITGLYAEICHKNATNTAFMDGHVEFIKRSEFYHYNAFAGYSEAQLQWGK
jgi:prepilin-type processing-associated H-X9-DG protein